MTLTQHGAEQRLQICSRAMAVPQHTPGKVDQDHRLSARVRLMSSSADSVPPIAASLREASR